MTVRLLGIHPSDSKQNPCIITPFTVIHFLSGAVANIILRKLNVSYVSAFIIWFITHMLYELKDLYGSYVNNSNDYYHNHSLVNSISDQVFALLGFIIGQNIPINFMTPFLIMFVLIVIIAYIIKAS